MTVTSIF